LTNKSQEIVIVSTRSYKHQYCILFQRHLSYSSFLYLMPATILCTYGIYRFFKKKISKGSWNFTKTNLWW